MQRNSIKLLITFAVFILLISCFNSVYAYKIMFWSKAIEDRDEAIFTQEQGKLPAVHYRMFEKASSDLSSKFSGFSKVDGWAYTTNSSVEKYMVLRKNSSGAWVLPGGGTSSTTYRQWSTIFHPGINTDYIAGTTYPYKTYTSVSEGITNSTDGAPYGGYFKTGINGEAIDREENGKNVIGYRGVYDAWAAFGNEGSVYEWYDEDKGLYSTSGKKGEVYEILNDKNSLWRINVSSSVLTSDRVITSENMTNIYNMFKSQIENGDPVYISDINYSDHRDKDSTRYLDTAYKFTKRKSGMALTSAETSILNTYDNYMYFPRQGMTKVYVRYIDVTGVDNITQAAVDEKAISAKNINKVGYAYSATQNKNIYSVTNGYGTNEEMFEITSSDLVDDDDYVRIYNKLYSDQTKTSKGQNITDTNNYSQYTLVGTVVGQGDDLLSAAENRAEKYNDFNSLQVREMVDIIKYSHGKCVAIDFLYSRTPPTTSTQVLVRHINVTGMDSVSSYKEIDSIANNGTLGTNVFDGYNRLMYNTSSTKSTTEKGKFKYPSTGTSYFNERYVLSDTRSYRLYNEFYNNSTTNYNYLGYVMSYSNYSLQDAENKRNDKINRLEFDKSNTFDGTGYATITRGNNQYILVDMYYTDRNVGRITNPTVKGRLEFNSVSDLFTDNTKDDYDHIPSSESMYASITGANKFMLGAIKVVPKVIDSTQEIQITVKVPYSYSYKYWSSSECGAGHSGTYGATCTRSVKCEGCGPCSPITGKCSDTWVPCGSTINVKVYSDGSGSGTITETFTYRIPYKYEYYKISNIRTYKITSMDLYDNENETDLALFGGKTYNVPVSSSYKNSVKGSFVQSTSSQKLTDNRSIDSITTEINTDEAGTILKETVTTANVAFDKKTYSDKLYTSSTAKQKFTSEFLNPMIEDIEEGITSSNAPTLTGVTKDGTINNGTSSNGSKVTFTIANDKISAGNVNLLVNTSKDTKTTTIEITDKYAVTNTNSTVTGTKPELKTDYPDNIYKQYGYSDSVSNPTIESDFSEDALNIPMYRLNGERISIAKIYYELVQDEDTSKPTLNFDTTAASQTIPHAWVRVSKTASGDTFADTEMNSSNTGEKLQTTIIPGNNLKPVITYNYRSSKTSTNHGTGDVVNIFTPIKYEAVLTNVQASDGLLIDHTTGGIANDYQIIQKDTRFKVTISPQGVHSTYTKLTADKMDEYIKEYYIKFDNLDVQEIRYRNENGSEISYNGGASVARNTWIGPIPNRGANTYISAITKDDPNEAGGIFHEEANTYTVRGITKNATSTMLQHFGNTYGTTYSRSLIDISTSNITLNSVKGSFGSSNTLRHTAYYMKKQLYNDANYVAQTTNIITRNLGRIYDFKVTDVKDIDWKNTFRKSSSSNTNVHSGIVYYSGNKKLNIYTTNFNELIRRNADEVGTGSERTLPVGPYKNINSAYTYAPKLGYRFSFDFKTTGKVTSAGKTAEIDVSFMFIDKKEGNITKDIDLWYKNSAGKYVKIGTASDNMNLYFVPNDGYRLTFEEKTYDFSKSDLSSKTVKLGTLTKLKLNKNMMATSDNQFAQIWYGEYKLPNSTIAVPKNETNLATEKLTNGYIAVKFDIKVTDEFTTIAYGQNNRNSSGNEIHNTSQWDYEGYLGYNGSNGAEASDLKLRLDKGQMMNIDDNKYNLLKGTVMLYDADARADSDYN